MKSIKRSLNSALVLRLSLILIVLSLSRISLYVYNTELFSEYTISEILLVFVKGLRFDLSVLFMLGSLLIVSNTLPFPFRKNVIYQKSVNAITIVVVSLAVVLNLSDAIYYRFTLKRMTFDVFNYLENNGGFIDLIPSFVVDFWYVFLSGALIIGGFIFFFKRISLDNSKETSNWKFYAKNSIYFLLWSGSIIVGIRGGLQLIPINVVDASLHAPAKLKPLVLNTPFTIIKSYGQRGLDLLDYYSEEEVEQLFNPIQSYTTLSDAPESVNNVVLIILESFSSEHIGYLSNKKTFTPFLDSLFEHSLVFKATANGKRSIEGIPAILSSLPTLSNEAFLNGPYAINQIEGLAETLASNGFETSFFHGGKNGTMNFDAYAYSSGFKAYYGLDEYPNKDDYDGHWGIWDEEYLSYFADMTNEFKEPFFTTLFTLSSHHPYSIPDKYENTLPNGKIKIQKAIAYTDLSLRKYFNRIKESDWFERTLFIFVADHTSEGSSAIYQNGLGQYSIPIAFYAPADSTLPNRACNFPVQQTDIFPSVLHYLGIRDTVLCFGNSVFTNSDYRFATNFYNNYTQVLDSSLLLQIEENQVKALYLYKEDSLLANNKVKSVDYTRLLKVQRAFKQQYNNRMIQNRLRAK